MHDLIAAGSFTVGSAEFRAMAAEVQCLDKHEAQELRDVLSGRKEIPGPALFVFGFTAGVAFVFGTTPDCRSNPYPP